MVGIAMITLPFGRENPQSWRCGISGKQSAMAVIASSWNGGEVMEVKSIEYYGNHYYAQCDECLFTVSIHADGVQNLSTVRARVRRHVARTGHRMTLEISTTIVYEPKQEGAGA